MAKEERNFEKLCHFFKEQKEESKIQRERFDNQQEEHQVLKDSVKKILEISSKHLKRVSLSDPKHNKGVELLDKAEGLAKKIDDPSLTMLVNRHKMNYFLVMNDTIMVSEYLDKNLKLIEQTGDNRELGLYYEFLSVFKNIQNKIDEGVLAIKKAEELLRIHGETKDLIDVNYNLCMLYKDKREWDASIVHALKSLEAIDKVGIKEDRKKHLYLFLAECYIRKRKLKEVKDCFEKIENDKLYKEDDPLYNGYLNQLKGMYYKESNDLLKSIQYYEKAAYDFYLNGNKRSKEISNSLVLANKLALKEEENKRIWIENELKEEQITSRGYIILLGIIAILGLIVFGSIQYRISLFKTKVNKQLKKNYRKLVKANKGVDKALKVKSEFLDAVTHELLTPLNTIKGTTFLLQKEKLSSQQENQIKLINVSSDHLLDLINDVIHFNELEKGEVTFKKEKINLKILINNLIDSSSFMRQNDNVIHRNIDEKIPVTLYGDVLRTSQVFLNVFDNALKFTKKGNIYVDALLSSREEGKVKIDFSIKDTGIGMSSKQISKVFEAFNQGSVKINRKYGGTGLGLSIAKKILGFNGDDISLKSEEGKGTSVLYTMNFDLFKEKETETKRNQVMDELDREVRVLLVEDNKVNQLMTQKILQDYGFVCETSNDGREAVAMVENNKYCIILMDIMMPVMDGFEATRRIKSLEPNVPVIGLTAVSEELHKEKFNEVGIYAVLGKPVNPTLLYQTIVNHCQI
ncbi:response regulator [Aquimarina sp. 2201CG5-10]|uniref:tetratricopeptide repeat-containing hybrid sensor histidine kinase/response regulator n=1 Tax=Aquimarina callyspongiae TaxID=3098150 RepID=UPI002AB41835|nr:response regulator [Aquimarina sp. 2201CG5-10]MDY8136821.1 response regulator [Aquimarina sp. 2201CG5-10]